MYITETIFELMSFADREEAKLYDSYETVRTIIYKAKKKVDALEIEDFYMSQVNIYHIPYIFFFFSLPSYI